jgi:hypothetical protein
MKIICGTLWKCLKDIEEIWSGKNGPIKMTYTKGKIYRSERSKCITNDQGFIRHFWGRTMDSEFQKYFKPYYSHKRKSKLSPFHKV